MTLALTIPGVVDSQDLHSLHPEPDGVTFEITFDYTDTATAIMRALESGERLELVVLTTDSGIIALDEVYVTSASYSAGDPAEFRCSLQARAVRWV
jgi:hypothetical protein